MTKEIILTHGQIALVDDEDYEDMNQYYWHIDFFGYVVRASVVRDFIYKKRTNIKMHRQLMGDVPSGYVIDHINRNKLDNRKSNLRIATLSQNQWNRGVGKNNVSGVTGVSYDGKRNKWCVQICVNKVSKNIGRYELFEDAVAARQEAEKKYFGDYAPKSGA